MSSLYFDDRTWPRELVPLIAHNHRWYLTVLLRRGEVVSCVRGQVAVINCEKDKKRTVSCIRLDTERRILTTSGFTLESAVGHTVLVAFLRALMFTSTATDPQVYTRYLIAFTSFSDYLGE